MRPENRLLIPTSFPIFVCTLSVSASPFLSLPTSLSLLCLRLPLPLPWVCRKQNRALRVLSLSTLFPWELGDHQFFFYLIFNQSASHFPVSCSSKPWLWSTGARMLSVSVGAVELRPLLSQQVLLHSDRSPHPISIFSFFPIESEGHRHETISWRLFAQGVLASEPHLI